MAVEQGLYAPRLAPLTPPIVEAPASRSDPRLDPRVLSTFLLDLYARAQELGYQAMQHEAFERFRALVPCDGGLFGVGTIQGMTAEAHDVLLFDKPPELMASWERIKHEDRLAFAAVTQPGTTFNIAASGPLYDGLDAVRAHCVRFELEYVMCTAHIYADAGLFWVMSVYRSATSAPFTEQERQTKELLSPHLFAATRRARIGELRTLTSVSGGHGQVAAVVSDAGLILEAESNLADILRAEWPAWRGPVLPAPLEAALRAGEGRFVGRRIVVRADRAERTRLLHVRMRVAADMLTDREREIASAFALGETHREIGDRLQIAPATVRRHLANLYEKLGVSSKAELDRMLRGTE